MPKTSLQNLNIPSNSNSKHVNWVHTPPFVEKIIKFTPIYLKKAKPQLETLVAITWLLHDDHNIFTGS